MLSWIIFAILAALIATAIGAALSAARWAASQPDADAPIDMRRRRSMPTGITVIVKQIEERDHDSARTRH